jgi:hypothetical protein
LPAALNLVHLVRLQLGEYVPKVVKSALVSCLELLKDEWGTRFPLLVNFLRHGDRTGQLVGAFRALALGLFDLLLRLLNILS